MHTDIQHLPISSPTAHKELARALGQPPPWFVGVVNVTPDSFSDGGCYDVPKKAIAHAYQLIADGAHIVDIGGESTGPGAKPLSAEEELRRVEPVVKAIASEMFVSVDTYHSETARCCLELGVQMINDISALRADPKMAKTVAQHCAFVVLMYSKENNDVPHATVAEKTYTEVIQEIAYFLKERIDYAVSHGVDFPKIICDPGMGQFLSSEPEISWQVLRDLSQLRTRGIFSPLMIGTSRKSFLGGKLLERDPLSQLSALVAYLKGVSLIRTHNVKMARAFFDVWGKTGMCDRDEAKELTANER